MTDQDSPVRLDLATPVATLTLHRPQARNAITPTLMDAVIDACATISATDAVRAVVVRGSGEHFSVGADLKAPAEPADTLLARRRNIERGQRMLRAIREVRQPMVCAVQGVATGGGACIATACDFRIAADTARMGYGEVKVGMNLMWQALPLAVALVGPSRAKQLVMSGRLVDAATLERWGFVDAVVPAADLDSAARAWAEEYAALPPVAVQMIKRSVDALSGALDGSIMHMDADQFLLMAGTDDAREGRAAFREKRPPVFTGR